MMRNTCTWLSERAAILVAILVLGSVTAAGADPRGVARVTWTAPAPGDGAPAVERFELRTAPSAPGGDWTAWWAAATAVPLTAIPGAEGTRHTATVAGIAAGATEYALVRAQGADGQWSLPSNALAIGTSALPFLTRVAPAELTPGFHTVVIDGVGLEQASSVSLVPASGGISVAASAIRYSAGRLEADIDVPAGPAVSLITEVVTPHGADRTSGWLRRVADSNAPPSAVTDLAAEALDGSSVRLRWTAPGDPGADGPEAATAYEARRLGGASGAWSWEDGTPIELPPPGSPGAAQAATVADLEPGHAYAFALRSRDAEGNWSELSNLADVTTPDPAVPPATVGDLVATALDARTVELRWTAPDALGGALAAYDLRRLAGSEADGWEYDTGTTISTAAPAAPGSAESRTVSGLPPGARVAFALRAANGGGPWSAVSNVAAIQLPAPPDTIPPDAAAEFLVTRTDDGSWALLWIAPSDQGLPVARYELRRHDGDPDGYAWATAAPVTAGPLPAAPGDTQVFPVTVPLGTAATFALMSYDAAGNSSEPSKPATADRRFEDGIAPGAPADLELSRFRDLTIQIRWKAAGDDGLVGRADRYELRVIPAPDVTRAWWNDGEILTLPLRPKPAGKRERYDVAVAEGGTVYGFALRAVDDASLVSVWVTGLLHVDGPTAGADTSPPTAPAGVTAQGVPGGVLIAWSASPDADVTAYRICRYTDGAPRGEHRADVPAKDLSWLDQGPSPSGAQYTVTAVDAAGNESPMALRVDVVGGPEPGSIVVRAAGDGWVLLAAPPASATTRTEPPRAEVFDVRGRLVAALDASTAGAGWEFRWNSASGGASVARGVYFVRVRGEGWAETRKLVVTR